MAVLLLAAAMWVPAFSGYDMYGSVGLQIGVILLFVLMISMFWHLSEICRRFYQMEQADR